MRILDEVSVINIRLRCKAHYIQYMEEIKNDETNLDEDGDDDSDEGSDESEEEGAEADLPNMPPPVAGVEENSGADQSSVDVEEQLRSSSSRTPSPSLAKMTAALHLNDVKDIVTSDLTKERARQQRKYHSKRGTRHAGRPQGSKAKQDTRVKLDRGGIWD